MLGRNLQSSKNGIWIACVLRETGKAGETLAQSDGFGTAGYAKVRDDDYTLRWIASAGHTRRRDMPVTTVGAVACPG
jgi:hypothetical protein